MPQRARTGNAGDEEQVRQAAEAEKTLGEEQSDDLFFVASTPEGRRFLMRLLDEAGVNKPMLVQSSQIYANAGRHDFGLEVKRWIDEVDPAIYLTMLREQKEADDARR